MDFRSAFSVSRAIRHGWEALRRAPFPLWLGAFLVGLSEGGCSGSGNLGNIGELFQDQGGDNADDLLRDIQNWQEHIGGLLSGVHGLPGRFLGSSTFDAGLLGGLALGVICCLGAIFLMLFALRCWVEPGYLRLHRQVLAESRGGFDSLFSGSDRFLAMLLWRLLSGVVMVGVGLVGAVPGGAAIVAGLALGSDALAVAGGILAAIVVVPLMVYVGLGLALGHLAVALEGMGPMEALERSWSLAAGNRLRLLLFLVVLAIFRLLGLVGLCLCLVGVLVTVPVVRAISDLGLTEAFLLHTGAEGAPDGWSLWRDLDELPV